jgi:transposase
MAARFVNVDRETILLLPPDMREWVPENHLVHFVIDAVGQLDVSAAKVNERGSGDEQYPPEMMLALLIYCYASGVFSSRAIQGMTYDSVAVRYLCGDTHPDHDTICTFRRENRALLSSAFAQVLELAARCKVVRVGNVTVAIDGTKVLANASRHAAVSYERAGQQMRQLELEIEELIGKAENADSRPLEDGLSIPEEIQRRQERKAKLAAARAEMEARAAVRAEAERGGYEAKKAEREAQRAAGKKPRGKEPPEPDATPGPKDQVNFTDAESRIMPSGGKGRFEQAYNAQAVVEVDSRLIVGHRVSNAPNDKEQLVPTFGSIAEEVGAVREVLIDSGFLSEEAVGSIEKDSRGEPTGTTVLAASGREKHGRTVAQLEKKDDPCEPEGEVSFGERMAHRVATKAGRARYKLRQQTVEPVFGIIKEAMGFRRFSLRTQEKVAVEWTLVCLAYNIRRLHCVGGSGQISLSSTS